MENELSRFDWESLRGLGVDAQSRYVDGAIPNEGTCIFRARLVDGAYLQAERLGDVVNSTNDQYNAFVSPDESFLIVPNGQRTDGLGGTDYYVVFRNRDDTWEGSYHLGPEVNSPFAKEWSAYVSPDNAYLFFMSDRGPGNPGTSKIFWIDASFLGEMRPSRHR